MLPQNNPLCLRLSWTDLRSRLARMFWFGLHDFGPFHTHLHGSLASPFSYFLLLSHSLSHFQFFLKLSLPIVHVPLSPLSLTRRTDFPLMLSPRQCIAILLFKTSHSPFLSPSLWLPSSLSDSLPLSLTLSLSPSLALSLLRRCESSKLWTSNKQQLASDLFWVKDSVTAKASRKWKRLNAEILLRTFSAFGIGATVSDQWPTPKRAKPRKKIVLNKRK